MSDVSYAPAGGWLTLIFINIALAAALDRSRGGVFVLSIFLGPFVTLYLAIAGKRRA